MVTFGFQNPKRQKAFTVKHHLKTMICNPLEHPASEVLVFLRWEIKMEFVRLAIILALPVLLFVRPKFIRDFFGDTVSIVLGFVSLAVIVIQAYLFY